MTWLFESTLQPILYTGLYGMPSLLPWTNHEVNYGNNSYRSAKVSIGFSRRIAYWASWQHGVFACDPVKIPSLIFLQCWCIWRFLPSWRRRFFVLLLLGMKHDETFRAPLVNQDTMDGDQGRAVILQISGCHLFLACQAVVLLPD